MKRRHFLEKTIVAAGALSIPGFALKSCAPKDKWLTILHTNDVHSQIDPYENTHPQFANMGGAAKRATLVKQIRQENPNTLLLDAGDIFQGTPYYNFYGGELEMKLMSMMGYDAAAIGNHDFDGGLDGLLAQMPHTKFELLAANYDFSKTVMAGYVKPYKVFVKDGIRVGVFGLGIALEGLVDPRMYKETVYLEPIETATKIVKQLKTEAACDVVICLSHLGYAYKNDKVSDRVLAAETTDIDIIIGGHTHTLMEAPVFVKNREGKSVLINQVGYKGVYMGRIDLYLGTAENTIGGGALAIG
ncbi:MAG: metallophosphatase [Bacteroidetes bacterium]|nr:metallophosphatase [Bacteroidota bacterium]